MLQVGEAVEIAAAIIFMDDSQTIAAFAKSFPSWVNIMPVTTFHADFVF